MDSGRGDSEAGVEEKGRRQDGQGEWRETMSGAPSGDVCVCPEEEVTHSGVPRGQAAPVEATAAARARGILGTVSRPPQQLPGCFPTFHVGR